MWKRVVLSHTQAGALLQARQTGEHEASLSLDLNRTMDTVLLEPARVVFPNGEWLTWKSIEEVADSEVACYVVEENAARKIQFFSEALNRHYSLMPTQRAPTMLISGLPMHRIKDIDPHEDTLRKIRTIAPIRGHVLDTATGLGYTAIEAARAADHVTTIELDPVALEVARLNPWSEALFNNAQIEQVIGDTFEIVGEYADESFHCIVHDPPAFSLAGELYSEEMYRQLFRVLRRGGRLFHYVGDPDSPSGGRVTKGVVRRLQTAGFTRIVRKPEAFGFVAHKL
jgi:hypothetical protein